MGDGHVLSIPGHIRLHGSDTSLELSILTDLWPLTETASCTGV